MISENLLQQAKAKGVHITVIPFIEVSLLDSPALSGLISGLPAKGITAVLTSKNSVAGLKKNMDIVPDWRIACLEGKTLDAAVGFFGKAAITITAADSGTLAAEIIRNNIKNVVFFCGNRRLDHLPEALQKAGITVQEITVYTTEETPVAVPRNYEGILFFSPTAVNSFFTANTLPPDCTTFAIGKTTAKALAFYTSDTIVISPVSDEQLMIKHVINYYNEERLIT